MHALVQVEGAREGALASCSISIGARPSQAPPAASSPKSASELDKLVFQEIAAWEAVNREALAVAQRSRDPYQLALQRQGLSPEGRALLEQWREVWLAAHEVPLLSEQGRAALEGAVPAHDAP